LKSLILNRQAACSIKVPLLIQNGVMSMCNK